MAQFNLVIAHPDAQQTRIVSALKTHWTTQEQDENGDVQTVVPTNAEVVEKLRQSVISAIKDIVKRVERDAAVQAAADAIEEVDAT